MIHTIFVLPLVVAIATTLIFLYADELPKWKVTAMIVLAISLVFQFVVPIHFVIPMLMQVGLSVTVPRKRVHYAVERVTVRPLRPHFGGVDAPKRGYAMVAGTCDLG